jgi:flagellar hook-basal body complex protein FliE
LSTGSAAAPFAGLLTEAVGQVSQLEQQARTAVEGLMAGTGVDVHEAMIATEKAGMGFELMLSVRNKALAAYQQVMGMQF